MKKLIGAMSMLLLGFTYLNAQQADLTTLSTERGPIKVHPIQHGTLALTWNEQTIYIDPTGGSKAFKNLPAPDMILITHLHGDHFDPETLQALDTQETSIIVPASVAKKLPEDVGNEQIILDNGEEDAQSNITVRAMPMYNLPEEGARHSKGWGNGYVLTIANKRVYISGDTEGIPEMRSLDDINMAFICMNLPYTMDVNQAADAVLDFKPDIVYPYHHRGQNIEKFKQLVNAKDEKIDVRLLNWYE